MVYLNAPIEKNGVRTAYGNRVLKLCNKTDQEGDKFSNVWVGHLKNGKMSYIFLNSVYDKNYNTKGDTGIYFGERAECSEKCKFLCHSTDREGNKYSMVIVSGGSVAETESTIWEFHEGIGWKSYAKEEENNE